MNRYTGNKIGWKTAASLVVANMIGTGVFTSLGFQLEDVQSTWSILILWLLGGVIALAGAFSYAELGSLFRRSGGEYQYLTEIYRPVVGYLSGWISLTVGFAAPVALAGVAMGSYLSLMSGLDPRLLATLIVILITVVHSFSIRHSSIFQNIVTVFKVLLIMLFIAAGFVLPTSATAYDWSGTWKSEMLRTEFAVALVFVTFSYTGWNAAAYIVEEIKDVRFNLPRALVRGTAVVVVLYVLLQLVFLRHATLEQLLGQVEVGQVAAINMLGLAGGGVVSLFVALFLVSSISSMVWVGPRVTKVMAEDHRIWRFLNKSNAMGIPVRAIWFQAALSLLLIWSGTFDQVLVYCGFILLLSGALAVLGTFLIQRKSLAMPYRNPTHPWLPGLFVLVSAWILIFLLYERPLESLLGLTNLLLGLVTYGISKTMARKKA